MSQYYHCTEVGFTSEFTSVAIMNPSDRKLAIPPSMHSNKYFHTYLFRLDPKANIFTTNNIVHTTTDANCTKKFKQRMKADTLKVGA